MRVRAGRPHPGLAAVQEQVNGLQIGDESLRRRSPVVSPDVAGETETLLHRRRSAGNGALAWPFSYDLVPERSVDRILPASRASAETERLTCWRYAQGPAAVQQVP